MSYDFEKMGLRKPLEMELFYKLSFGLVKASNVKVIRAGEAETGLIRTLDFPVEFCVGTNGGRHSPVIFEDDQTMTDILEDILVWAEHNKDDINNLDEHAYGTRSSLLKSLYEWFVVTEEDINER